MASKPVPGTSASKPAPGASASTPAPGVPASTPGKRSQKPKPGKASPRLKPDVGGRLPNQAGVTSKPKLGKAAPKPLGTASKGKPGTAGLKRGKLPGGPKTQRKGARGQKSRAYRKQGVVTPKKVQDTNAPERSTDAEKPDAVLKKQSLPPPSPISRTDYKLTLRDNLLIAAIWNYEIVATLTEAWKSSLVLYTPSPTSRDLNFVLSKNIARSIQLVLTILATAAVAFFTDKKPKFDFMIGGLCFYLLTPIAALFVTNVTEWGFSDLLLLPHIAWVSVFPIRYWIIFHQKFPLTVIETRTIITYNELFIDLTNYISKVWISYETFSPRVYNIAWSLLLVIMCIWLGLLFFVKRWLSTTGDDVEEELKIYQQNHMEDSFLARQKTEHVILFMCLILPCMMISMQKATVSYVFRLLRHELSIFARYRFDLVIALSFLPTMTSLLITILSVRQELRDLFVIGIAHILNITICAVFVAQIVAYSNVRHDRVGSRSYEWLDLVPIKFPINTVFAFFFFPDAIYDNLQIVPSNSDLYYLDINDNSVCAFLKKGTRVTCMGHFPNQTVVVIAEDKIITRNSAYYFHSGSLRKISKFCQYMKPMPTPEPSIMWIVSGFEHCRTGHSRDVNGSKVLFRNGCHSLNLSMNFVELDSHRPITDSASITLPFLGEEPNGTIIVPEKACRLYFEATLDGVPIPAGYGDAIPPAKERQETPYFMVVATLVNSGGTAAVRVVMNSFQRYVHSDPSDKSKPSWPSSSRQSLMPALSAASVVTGVASASYVHFIWIQCPSSHRMWILAAFVCVDYFGSVLPIFLISELLISHFVILLCFQVVGGALHVCASYFFYRHLRMLNDRERSDLRKMQF